MQPLSPASNFDFLCNPETREKNVLKEINASRATFQRLDGKLHIKVVTTNEDASLTNSYDPLSNYGFQCYSDEQWKSNFDKESNLTTLTREPCVFARKVLGNELQITATLGHFTAIRIEKHILNEAFFQKDPSQFSRVDLCPALHMQTKRFHLLVLAPNGDASFSLISYADKTPGTI